MEFVLNFVCDTKEKAEIIFRQTVLQDVLKQMLEYLKRLPRAAIFLSKVNKKDAPGYFDIIKNPMDLGTMTKKLVLYRDLDEFREDIELIVENCLTYNKNIDYYVDCANELRSEADALFMKYRKVVPKVPKSFDIDGIEIVDGYSQLRRIVLKYLKMVGFDTADKQCIDILCDLVKHKICDYITIAKSLQQTGK